MHDTIDPAAETPPSETASAGVIPEPARRGPDAPADAPSPTATRFSFVAGTDTTGVCGIEGECH